MTPANRTALILRARALTATGSGGEAGHARRAFDLAHRAFRRLELAAEAASRDRWDMLQRPQGRPPSAGEDVFAAEIARAVIRYPVHGEAAVYAALLDAVDLAHLLDEQLYRAWLETERTDPPANMPAEPVNRLGAPLAPGCSRRECCASGDEVSPSDGENG